MSVQLWLSRVARSFLYYDYYLAPSLNNTTLVLFSNNAVRMEDAMCLYLAMTQLVKVLAAPTQCLLMCAGGPGSIHGADKLDSGCHSSGVAKLRSSFYVAG